MMMMGSDGMSNRELYGQLTLALGSLPMHTIIDVANAVGKVLKERDPNDLFAERVVEEFGGWYDHFVGLEGESMTLREFFDRLGINKKHCDKAWEKAPDARNSSNQRSTRNQRAKGEKMPSTLIAFCSECEVWLEPSAAGEPCPMTDCTHKLRKRRMWLCDCCEERFAFPSRTALFQHKEKVSDAHNV